MYGQEQVKLQVLSWEHSLEMMLMMNERIVMFATNLGEFSKLVMMQVKWSSIEEIKEPCLRFDDATKSHGKVVWIRDNYGGAQFGSIWFWPKPKTESNLLVQNFQTEKIKFASIFC